AALSAAELKNPAVVKAAGWKIAADGAWSKTNTWAQHASVNDGFPYLTGVTVNPVLCNAATLSSVSFTGNSSKLSKTAKAKLAANAGAIKASGCSTVSVKAYKGASKKSKAVAAKRAAVVQAYLQNRLWDAQYFVKFGNTSVKSKSAKKLKTVRTSVG
ncbi:MAG: OmpA family protein, partial [Actinobacteria bacterium]|nr:OmpA family protein [Actinomycetota bacterium]